MALYPIMSRGGSIVRACLLLIVASVATPAARAADGQLPATIEFNRDIRPILSNNCYACHGFDKNKRKGNLRLDIRDGIFGTVETRTTVVPGHPEKSELWRRVSSTDHDEVMPKPSFNKKLTPREVALIKLWIEQGADWKGHWAYLKPVRPPVPAADGSWARNPIDNFILEKLRDAGMKNVAEADRVTLIRRLSFDLTGLPPAKSDVDAFVADKSSDAYEKLVDRMLADPHFGERMAMYWLDMVRYADSIGYHSDNPMPVSPFRDYVIQSFNTNLPFNEFTREQLGGDLIANPTTAAKIASTYNRLLQTTEEGGAQAKEYIAKYDADRVRNVSTVWMGATMGCCQCHDHKFDPFATKDFYSMAAFFADIQEAAVGGRGPGTPVPNPQQEQHIKELESKIAAAKAVIDGPHPELAAAQVQWEQDIAAKQVNWVVIDPLDASVAGESHLRKDPGGVLVDFGKVAARENYTITAQTDLPSITGIRLEAMDDDAFPAHGPGISPNGNFVLTELLMSAGVGNAKLAKVKLQNASADFSQDGFPVANAIDGKGDTGWAVMPSFGKTHTAVFETDHSIGGKGTTLSFILQFQSAYPQHQIGKFRLAITGDAAPSRGSLPPNVRTVLAIPAAQRNDAQKNEVAAYFRTVAPALQPQRDEIATLEKEKAEFLKGLPTTLVTTAGAPRTIRVLARGNWQDDSGAIVTPAIPAFLGKIDTGDRRPTRLDLANWLVARDNPLTARVFVNRLWKLYFGQGLSKVLDDLGSQGEWPTHPELIDWLAVEFMEPTNAPGGSTWDVKHMVKLMVTSATYRQSSVPTSDQKEKDPYNRLYARQSRFRLDAETVRDNALAISGLLIDSLGGSSVKPYQPAGYWDALNFPTRTWTADKGPNEYRRGLYTWWQRSFLHPSLLAFDAPSREEAVCERNRSNIPQQALVLLNDPSYVEASRAFAERIVRQGGMDTAARMNWAFGQALSRTPRPEELGILTGLLEKQQKEFAGDMASAEKFLQDGDHPVPKELDKAELAAWTNLARVILNLHETITRL